MRTLQSEIICQKVVNLFNFQSREQAKRLIKRFDLTSYHFLSIELKYSSSSLSSFCLCLYITDGHNSCLRERFTNIQDLFKYVRVYNIGIDINIHDLNSIL